MLFIMLITLSQDECKSLFMMLITLSQDECKSESDVMMLERKNEKVT